MNTPVNKLIKDRFNKLLRHKIKLISSFCIITLFAFGYLLLPYYLYDYQNNIMSKVSFINSYAEFELLEERPQIIKDVKYEIVRVNSINHNKIVFQLILDISDYFGDIDGGIVVATYGSNRDGFTISTETIPNFTIIKNLEYNEVALLAKKHNLASDFPGKEDYCILASLSDLENQECVMNITNTTSQIDSKTIKRNIAEKVENDASPEEVIQLYINYITPIENAYQELEQSYERRQVFFKSVHGQLYSASPGELSKSYRDLYGEISIIREYIIPSLESCKFKTAKECLNQ